MRPLSELATDQDTVELIMNQLPVLDGLLLARTSKVWRDASHDVLGYLRTYAATMRDFALLSKSAMAKPITVIYRAKILERLESLSVNSEMWRPVYGPLKAKYAGPVTKLTGLGWEEMRTLSD